MTQTPNVFISYSARDEGTARATARALHKAGVEVWTPAEITPGDKFKDTLWQKLEQADIVVLLITADFVRSPSNASEFGASLALKKRILTVVVGNVPDDQILFSRKRGTVLHVDSKAEVPKKVAEFLQTAAAA